MSDSAPCVVSSVLNWNNYRDTAACLEALQGLSYHNHRLLVIDNGSTDGSSKKLEHEFPQITLINSSENLGFAGGHNLAIERALEQGADYVWILNNDTFISNPLTLTQLVQQAESNTSIGALSPLVYRYPNMSDLWFSRGKVNIDAGAAWHANDATAGDGLIRDNDYLPFCATLFPISVFEEIGLLSDDYFLYLEDADFCQRLLESGYELVTDTDSHLFHKESSSSGGKVSPTSLYYIARNRWLFARRWSGEVRTSFYRTYLQWLVLQTVRCGYNSRPSGLPALILGTRDGWQGKTGKGPYP
ncbi:glycosyltransferase family 2 protein [Haloprofundus salinisoli]|uniref:glycosyltransferase family 2 protein n=1 Tax=Haloprofundus salinisoli TaxID=2876193 RepID=UPI001CCB6EFA|nr:glycosyltransferase family 2 protein [Haloprofundus salinisoli]